MSELAPSAQWLLRAIGLLILAFLVVPSLLIVPMSFSTTSFLQFPPRGFSLQWYETFLSDPAWVDATLFSLQIAAGTTVCASIIGVMAAIGLVRGRIPGRSTIEALVLAPLIVPHVVVAIAVYAQFAPLGLTGTRFGFVLIHTALAIPYVVLVVSAALHRLPPSLEMAALNLGASRLRAFQLIVLPLIAPAAAAGAVFAFLASFDETVVAFFISGIEQKTVTRKLLEDIEFSLSPVVAAASTVFVAATIVLMWLADTARRTAKERPL